MEILKTKRLTLRPLKCDDAEAMYQNWTHDPRVAKYCRWHAHESLDVTKQLLEMYLDEAEKGFRYRWGIELTDSTELIGCIDVVGTSEDGETAMVGYVLSHDYWNRGYMTESLSVVIKTLFEAGFSVVAAEHHVENPASGKVMEKCGMEYTHHGKALSKFGSDALCDVKWYCIKKQ